MIFFRNVNRIVQSKKLGVNKLGQHGRQCTRFDIQPTTHAVQLGFTNLFPGQIMGFQLRSIRSSTTATEQDTNALVSNDISLAGENFQIRNYTQNRIVTAVGFTDGVIHIRISSAANI